jgi:hypothetical protein
MTAIDQRVEDATGCSKMSPEATLLFELAEHVDNARTQLLRFDPAPQSEWMGGDSSNPKNFKMREPNCVPLPRGYLT